MRTVCTQLLRNITGLRFGTARQECGSLPASHTERILSMPSKAHRTPRNNQRRHVSPIAHTRSGQRFGFLLAGIVLGVSVLSSLGGIQVAQDYVPSQEATVSDRGDPCSTVPASGRRILPEYDRQMRRVVVSLSSGDANPELQDEVLRHLPSYTQILFLIPADRFLEIKDWIATRPYGSRTTLVTYDPHYRRGARLYLLLPDEDQLVAVDTEDFHVGTQHGTIWAQDLFEATSGTDSKSRLLTSCVHKCFQGMRNRSDLHVASDNSYLDRLEDSSTTVQQLDLAFKGGNVLCDTRCGNTIAFCGYDSIRSTRTIWSAFHGETLSDREIIKRFQKALGVDRVILAGPTKPQPKFLYHLDQAMLLLPDARVAVSRVVGATPRLEPDASQVRAIQAFLADLRATLEELGYSIVDIETPVESVLQYQHYVNAIPYIDVSTGRRTLLMPVFPSTASAEIVARNTKRLEQLGFQVRHVTTSAYRLSGGIHCLVNVLE